MYIQITVEINRWSKEKYFAVSPNIYDLKVIYLYLYKKIYSLRKLAVVFMSVISGKIFIRYINIQLLYFPCILLSEMEWEILTEFLPEMDLPFHEDNPKVKEMTSLVSSITLPHFFGIANNHGQY